MERGPPHKPVTREGEPALHLQGMATVFAMAEACSAGKRWDSLLGGRTEANYKTPALQENHWRPGIREVTAQVAHSGSCRKNGNKQKLEAGRLLKDTATTVTEDEKRMCILQLEMPWPDC